MKLETHGPVPRAEQGLYKSGRTWIVQSFAVHQARPEIPRKQRKPLKHGGRRDGFYPGPIRRTPKQPTYPSFPFPVLKSIAAGEGIEPRPGMGVDTQIRGIFLPEVIQTKGEDAMLEDIRGVSRMKGMTIAEHPLIVPKIPAVEHPDYVTTI
jgi:hypothetical protein